MDATWRCLILAICGHQSAQSPKALCPCRPKARPWAETGSTTVGRFHSPCVRPCLFTLMFVTFTIGNRNTCTSKSILVCSSCVPRIINLIPALFPTNWQWPWIFLCLKECYCVSQPNVHNIWVFVLGSPCAHLHVVRMLRFMSARSQPSLPTPFFIEFLCLFMSIWPVQQYFVP